MPLDEQDKIWLTQALREQSAGFQAELEHWQKGLAVDVQHLQQGLGALENGQEGLRAELERMETALLTEFHKWASPTDQKLRSHRESLRALDLEIEAIAGRVTKLEADMDLRQ